MKEILGLNDYNPSEHQEPLALLVHNRDTRLRFDNQLQNIANRLQSKSTFHILDDINNLSNQQPISRGNSMRSAASNSRSNKSCNRSPSRSPNNSLTSVVAENDMVSSDSETMNLSGRKKSGRTSVSPDREDNLSISSRGSTPHSEVGAFWSTLSTPPTVAEAPKIILCYWCKRVCDGKRSQPDSDFSRGNFPFTNGDGHFCSEVCFNQCRRASFKKSKICDWCRLVKPTVSYVDFTDGDHQLQFCSDKCLNQYKMQIFCRETEAHLQLHPHLSSLAVGSHAGALITPDLWLKDCRVNSNSKTETTVDEEAVNEPSPTHVSSDLRHIHPAGYGMESQLSVSDSSSPSSFDDCEPVNLSTSHHQNDFRDSAKQDRKTSPMSTRTRSAKQLEDSNRTCLSRYGRPKARATKDFGETISSNLKRGKSPLENIDIIGETKPKGTIRVRQLEEQPHQSQSEDMINNSSPSPTISKATVSGYRGFEGLMLGARQPLLPGIPSLLPPPPHSDISRPQILPQLLLSHPDFLRFQGLRPPFYMPQPPVQPPTQQPPPAAPPPQPVPPPQTTPQYSLGFPPVTVLLPLPLPIPIPIPIPLPFPILINSGKCSCMTSKNSTQARNNSTEESASATHNHSTDAIIDNQAADKKSPDSSAVSPPITVKLRKQKEVSADSQKTNAKSFTKAKDLPVDLPDSGKMDKKERRSILKYTSDVYEINGVFAPREGSWHALSKPATLAIQDKESEPVISCPSPPTTSTSNELLLAGNEARCSTSKKRTRNADQNEPIPKKKHLLT